MAVKRKPFQGVINIIRFNHHFYWAALVIFILTLAVSKYLPVVLQPFVIASALLAAMVVMVSLVVSCYIYDFSGLYQLSWLPALDGKRVLNINAGFDETSEMITQQYEGVKLTVCDFYNPEQHTEISLRRARKAYPPVMGTVKVSAARLPFPDNSFDYTLAIFSAHEIRREEERVEFFRELNRVTGPGGQILVTEHLRDRNNFLAYTLGVFHFHSHATWMRTFRQSNLTVVREVKSTPFITTFVLEKNGNAT